MYTRLSFLASERYCWSEFWFLFAGLHIISKRFLNTDHDPLSRENFLLPLLIDDVWPVNLEKLDASW